MRKTEYNNNRRMVGLKLVLNNPSDKESNSPQNYRSRQIYSCHTPSIRTYEDHESPSSKPRYQKHKNFYLKSKQCKFAVNTPSEVKAYEVLNKICYIKPKKLLIQRPESTLERRKGFSIECSTVIKPLLAQAKRAIRPKPARLQNFTYDSNQIKQQLNTQQFNDWLDFVFDND